MLSKIIDTRPATTSISAWPLPLKGTCTTSMRAMLLNSSAVRCVELPAPEEAKVSLPGSFFASATSSATFFAGSSLGTASTLLIEAMKITGSRSLAAS